MNSPYKTSTPQTPPNPKHWVDIPLLKYLRITAIAGILEFDMT